MSILKILTDIDKATQKIDKATQAVDKISTMFDAKPASSKKPPTAEEREKWVKARKTYLFRNQSLAKAIKYRYIQQLRRLYQDGQLHFTGKTRGLASPASFGQLVHALNKKD